MSYTGGFPTANFSITDDSGASTEVLYAVEDDGLNVPFQFIMAERGEPGRIYYGAGAELTPVFGSETFNEASAYYTTATRFLQNQMARQGVNAIRLVDPAATVASLGLFLEVWEADIIQYQTNSDGVRVIDSDGDFIPLMTTDQVPVAVTAPGLKVRWVVRALTSQENYRGLIKTTVVDGSNSKDVYPIKAFKVRSPGKYGNRQGFKLYSTGSEMATVANALGSIVYRFVPIALPTSVSTTASTIPDINGQRTVDVSFKDTAVYDRTGIDYSARYVLGNNYVNAVDGETTLPYDVYTYGTNIGIVGALVVAGNEDLEGVDPYMIDLISGTDLEGAHYTNLEVDADSTTVVNSDVINYASGGSDGEVSFAKLQELIVSWLEGTDHGEFGNMFQHGMTHMSDPGFALETKYALFNLLDIRDNIKLDICTQDVSMPPNTKAEDLSIGHLLAERARMHPESIITGVGCMRVSIFAHAGYLTNGTPYTGLVPFSLHRAIQRGNLAGGTYIRGSAGGRPNSEVTMFRKPNWAADDTSSRSRAWDIGINTVMYANRNVIFYPALRTVFPNDTSLLVEDEFSDVIIYMRKIAREVWTIYAGVTEPSESIWPQIEREIDNRCAFAFAGSNVRVKATLFQTAADENLGYVTSVNLAISGTPALRQMNFNVIVGRTE